VKNTSQGRVGQDNKNTEEEMETSAGQQALSAICDSTGTMKRRDDGSGAAAARTELRESLSFTEVMVGLVDSAREEDKARTVVEICRAPLKRGRCPWLPPL